MERTDLLVALVVVACLSISAYRGVVAWLMLAMRVSDHDGSTGADHSWA